MVSAEMNTYIRLLLTNISILFERKHVFYPIFFVNFLPVSVLMDQHQFVVS